MNLTKGLNALAFGVLIVFLVVAASAWIMSDLAESMIAGQPVYTRMQH